MSRLYIIGLFFFLGRVGVLRGLDLLDLSWFYCAAVFRTINRTYLLLIRFDRLFLTPTCCVTTRHAGSRNSVSKKDLGTWMAVELIFLIGDTPLCPRTTVLQRRTKFMIQAETA